MTGDAFFQSQERYLCQIPCHLFFLSPSKFTQKVLTQGDGVLAKQPEGHVGALWKARMCQAQRDKELLLLVSPRSSYCDQERWCGPITPGPLHPRGRARWEGIRGGEPRRETLIPNISSNRQSKR